MQQQVDLTFNQERAVASLAGLFGMVALVLAAVGLYGVTAYTVAQRTNEIGIRMTLGADRAKVMQLVLAGAFRRVLIGLLLGLPLAVEPKSWPSSLKPTPQELLLVLRRNSSLVTLSEWSPCLRCGLTSTLKR